MTPELNAKIQLYTQKALAGTLTQEEMKEALMHLRGTRVAAAAASAKSGARKTAAKAKASIDSNDLLSELDDI